MVTTTIKQSEVNVALQNKLGEADIKASSDFCKKGAMRNQLNIDILIRRGCTCEEKDSMLVTIPEGNVNSDIMFIGEPPSELDGKTHTTFFDASGRLMTVVLDKLGLTRDNIYVTNVTKCCVSGDIREKAYTCTAKFLLREIDLVRPKMIVTLGPLPAEILRSFAIDDSTELQDIQHLRGKLFKGRFGEYEFNFIHTHSPAFVLSKNGAMYNKYKVELWNDVSGAYKAVQQAKKAS